MFSFAKITIKSKFKNTEVKNKMEQISFWPIMIINNVQNDFCYSIG
jgi:hypothetical protein